MSATDVNVTLASSAPRRSRSATRKRLRSSAVRLFAQRGLHGVTSHEIARGAGVASGTFYLHFADKATLYQDIVEDGASRLAATIAKSCEKPTEVAALVRAEAVAVVSFAEKNQHLVRILFGSNARITGACAEVLDCIASTFEAALERARAQGTLADELAPAPTAQALAGMTARLIHWWSQDPKRASRDQIIRSLVRLQLCGLGEKR